VSPCGHTMYLGDSDGLVAAHDLRSNETIWAAYAHDNKVQTVNVHPTIPHYLATSSLDRSVKIFDLRKVSSNKKASSSASSASKPEGSSSSDADDHPSMEPLATFVESRSVNCAYWSPSGNQLLSVTQSNFLRLFNKPYEQSGKAIPVAGEAGLKAGVQSISHDNQTGRYLPVFHAAWDPKCVGGSEAFVVGSMKQPRMVEVFTSPADLGAKGGGGGAKPTRVMCFGGEYLNSVQSRNVFHPTHDIVVCGNASGRVHVFR